MHARSRVTNDSDVSLKATTADAAILQTLLPPADISFLITFSTWAQRNSRRPNDRCARPLVIFASWTPKGLPIRLCSPCHTYPSAG
ncbi:hypothetical protein M413DRAFT_445470 [Hebeloma cylindrosporum]|uniref:Uncharacterized protein n=1 Tax=Hebeloma cylindrosporum TaxID=76867 RepID=A0A0C2YKA7_HEBCY|nr:hypothetical protein M413DRAFT_445470 [Hebeloma cylindrosporum h7]